MGSLSLIPRPSLFGFPGTLPSFNPFHIAALQSGGKPTATYSCVASTGNLIELLTAKAGTLNGIPTAVMDGRLGPATKYLTTARSLFTVGAVNSTASLTFAAIFEMDSISATNQVVIKHGTTSSNVFRANATTGVWSINAVNTNLTIAAATRYFIASSFLGGSKINSVLVNLSTGGVTTDSVTTAVTVVGNQTALHIGNSDTAGAPMNGFLAAVALIYNKFLTVPQLLSWAADPWSFWYPPSLVLLPAARAASRTVYALNLAAMSI